MTSNQAHAEMTQVMARDDSPAEFAATQWALSMLGTTVTPQPAPVAGRIDRDAAGMAVGHREVITW